MRLRWIAAAVAACAIVLALWATRWSYYQPSGRLVRVNRYTGDAYRLTYDGWEKMDSPRLPDVEPMRPAPAVMDTGFAVGTDSGLPRTGPYSDSAYDEAAKRIRESRARH